MERNSITLRKWRYALLLATALACLVPLGGFAQQKGKVLGIFGSEEFKGGLYGMGMRNSINYFGSDGLLGMGGGGQFKLSFGKRVNSDWFVDLMHSRGKEGVFRRDYHIGWAVQFALNNGGFGGKRWAPYVMAGQCFDLSQVGFTGQYESPLVFTAAAQGGIGISKFIGNVLEMNLQTHYMMHLGTHVHPFIDGNGIGHVEVEKGAELSGHMLSTLSFTVYFLRLWNK